MASAAQLSQRLNDSGDRAGDVEQAPKQFSQKPADRPKTLYGLPVSLVAGFFYVIASMSMVLTNKHALSSFEFRCPNALLLFQCIVAVSLVKISSLLGYCQLEPISWKIVKVWFPVNLVFVGMIWTSFYALQNMGVAMVTVLKNLTNIITICGDYVFFGRTYPLALWGSMLVRRGEGLSRFIEEYSDPVSGSDSLNFSAGLLRSLPQAFDSTLFSFHPTTFPSHSQLMIVSAVSGAITDLSFNAAGYTWQILNCVFTAGYSLYLRSVMDKVAPLTSNKKPLGEFSMVLYNNLLSIPPIFVLMVAFGEFDSLREFIEASQEI